MDQQRVHSFPSSSYPYTVNYPGYHDLTRCNSHGQITSAPGQASFNERPLLPSNNFGGEPTIQRSLSAPIDAFESWLLEEAHCGSPISTNSSGTSSDNVQTPSYTGLPMPIFDAAEQSFHYPEVATTSYGVWTSEAESMWRPDFNGANPCDSQPYELPYHSVHNYATLPLQRTNNYMPPTDSAAAPSFTPSYYAPATYHAAYPMGLDASKRVEPNSNAEISLDSDSDSSDSEHDDDSPQESSRSSSKNQPKPNVLKLGKWSPTMDLYITAEQRHYVCPLEHKDDPDRLCLGSFVRPEHLRRHIKTVHGGVKNSVCKVPTCKRPFSRGDNLREHYFTHLSRGGRVGKNHKMTWLELKEILGPRDKKLAKTLKVKLQKHMNKRQLRAKL
ncbi:hypothetical protein EJ02DRAFT_154328 [Clathrospora elynae]|uniref:C2H2-type domain-containing protein n=1 Tax=Clathrospora elynae TaxID=706981 RepID=A0A6A5T196_9PLEO|nr:hypothetical protein EJ02DRAFT_154328 [Clathrospora elynae]